MQIMKKIHAVQPNITLPARSSAVTYKNRLKGLYILLSPTYGLDDCPQSLQQLPQGHLFCLHPQDHPPEGQWKTSCPANRHFCSRKRQLACFSRSTSESRGWGRRWERGTVATADPAKRERRRRKVDQPRMWRHCCCLVWFMEAGGENSVRLLSCLGEMEAFKCGGMLPRLMKGRCWWKCSDGDSRQKRRWVLGVLETQVGRIDEAAGSLIRTFMLQHQHTWWCKPVWSWQTEGGGDVKVRTAVVTQQQIIQEWHLV